MNKCSPVEMRKNLQIVDSYRVIGLDFVAIPVKNEAHKLELMSQSDAALEEVIRTAEELES